MPRRKIKVWSDVGAVTVARQKFLPSKQSRIVYIGRHRNPEEISVGFPWMAIWEGRPREKYLFRTYDDARQEAIDQGFVPVSVH